MKKIKITEQQFKKLEEILTENAVHTNLVKQIKTELDANYSPTIKFVRKGGEYTEKPMVLVLADEEVISPESLFEYMKYKYKMNDEFIKQVISDWMFGRIDDNFTLSKNIAL
jgi:hypothetical protein